MELWWLLAILCVAFYFLGNINFAKILTRLSKTEDSLKTGSGNPGTTNMLRTVGAKMGALTLVLDMLKGAIPALIGLFVFGGAYSGSFPFGVDGSLTEAMIAMYACGLAAILGHIYPVLYKFKGGKGAATMLGVFAVAQPLVFVIWAAVGLSAILPTKYISPFSMFSVAVLVVAQSVLMPFNLVVSLLLFAYFVVIWWAFRSNIVRFLVGKENVTDLGKALAKDRERKAKRMEAEAAKAEKREEKEQKKEEKAEKKEAKKQDG
ncbi:MAG: glycerol-3-phosphate acyltransferase [Firmicutes bacterium]|nr:glycerol-3-phosphate acyltransferase [Bacillota bacterium]